MIRQLRAARFGKKQRARARQSGAPREDVPAEAAPQSGRADLPDLLPAHSNGAGEPELRLPQVPLRELVQVVRIDLPPADVEPLLELGLLPGCLLCSVRRSPFGDPVLQVDGSLIAVRREMAHCICVRPAPETATAGAACPGIN